jgi:hypothetical protein
MYQKKIEARAATVGRIGIGTVLELAVDIGIELEAVVPIEMNDGVVKVIKENLEIGIARGVAGLKIGSTIIFF